MGFDVIVEPMGRFDLFEIIDGYEKIKSGLGQKFYEEFIKYSLILYSHPFIFQERHKNIRALSLLRFPYNVYYFIEEKNVHIIAIAHHKRHSKIWKKRI